MFDKDYWFSKKNKKFLHNIDTFYFSVKLEEDFTLPDNSRDVSDAVRRVRYVISHYKNLDINGSCSFDDLSYSSLILFRHGTFARFYNFWLYSPDMFDFFFAPVVPLHSSGESLTSEILVQIRSKLLWEIGPKLAYDKAMEFVQAFCDKFNLHIKEIKENRCDFCWHTNALEAPEKFFSLENLAVNSTGYLGRDREGSRVFKQIAGVDSSDETIDIRYTCLGKRGDKCFLRIYHKSQEVIQEGYKSFFFYQWFFNGLISRYDLYCYELAYKERKYNHIEVARCKFIQDYLMHELSFSDRILLYQFLAANKPDYAAMHKFADIYLPKVTKIYNVEYQVMRKMSKTFILRPFKENTGINQRIYDFFDNHESIAEYLTHEEFRMINRSSDSNKSRCDYCDFWRRLRGTKMIDAPSCRNLKLIRDYSSKLDLDIRKKKAIRSISSTAYAITHDPDTSLYEDVSELLSILNDNDLHDLRNYKINYSKQSGHLSDDELIDLQRFRSIDLFDPDTGEIYGTKKDL